MLNFPSVFITTDPLFAISAGVARKNIYWSMTRILIGKSRSVARARRNKLSSGQVFFDFNTYIEEEMGIFSMNFTKIVENCQFFWTFSKCLEVLKNFGNIQKI